MLPGLLLAGGCWVFGLLVMVAAGRGWVPLRLFWVGLYCWPAAFGLYAGWAWWQGAMALGVSFTGVTVLWTGGVLWMRSYAGAVQERQRRDGQ